MKQLRTFPNWEEFYEKTPEGSAPWFMLEFDRYLEQALGQLKINTGKVLEVGSGSGIQAIELAKRGFDVTATDLSYRAVSLAQKRSKEQGLIVDFKQDDILDSCLEEKFDIILDRGCFHCFHPEQVPVYVHAVSGLLNPKGYLLIQCRSNLESTNLLRPYTAPYRYAPKDIEEVFGCQFSIISIENAQYSDYIPGKPSQLFCILRLSH